ncbi:hypothetical protein RB195_015836 [Necator americanus]|uniref:Uncharacterized protein n=1 Tax=Necator americanus TaxID=51031 RepID=A0ABR1E6C6_NECAM
MGVVLAKKIPRYGRRWIASPVHLSAVRSDFCSRPTRTKHVFSISRAHVSVISRDSTDFLRFYHKISHAHFDKSHSKICGWTESRC